MSALAAFRISILALLSDATNVIFSNNDVDQALRWALSEYSLHRPLLRTYIYSVDATTGVHTLPSDFITRHITKVELYDEDSDSIVEQGFYSYIRDEQWVIETKIEIQAGEVLQITYSTTHTIDDLDAAAGTTIPAIDESVLHVGAAGHAAQMRALDRIETINMNKDVVNAYRQLAAEYLSRFALAIIAEPGVAVAALNYPDNLVF